MTHDLERKKGNQACEILEELDLDCWLVWVRETSEMPDPVLKLVLGGDLVWHSALLYTRSQEQLAIVGNFDADGLAANGLYDRIIPYDGGISDALRRELARIDPQRIAVNISRDNVAADGLTVGMHAALLDALEGTPYGDRLVSAADLVGRLRGRKLPEEVARIERAVAITERIFEEATAFLRVGQTEEEIHRFFHERMAAHGVGDAWQAAGNPAVDAGPNKAFGHTAPSSNPTKPGHLLHFDFGVRADGYCSDLQRMVYFGAPEAVPDQVRNAFETVRGAIAAAAAFLRPGVRGREVDAVARSFVVDAGYPEFKHALGHQVGRSAHDGGTILGPPWERYGETVNGIVEADSVFTLELHVPTEDYGSVSLEEDILVTAGGCRFLSRPQRELICLP